MAERPTRQYFRKAREQNARPRRITPATAQDMVDLARPEGGLDALGRFMLAQRLRFGLKLAKLDQRVTARQRARMATTKAQSMPEHWTRRGLCGGHNGPQRVGLVDEALDPMEAMDAADE